MCIWNTLSIAAWSVWWPNAFVQHFEIHWWSQKVSKWWSPDHQSHTLDAQNLERHLLCLYFARWAYQPGLCRTHLLNFQRHGICWYKPISFTSFVSSAATDYICHTWCKKLESIYFGTILVLECLSWVRWALEYQNKDGELNGHNADMQRWVVWCELWNIEVGCDEQM